MAICGVCGGHEDVRHGLCGACRDVEHRDTRPEPGEPDAPELEQAHDQPWVARSAFTGRRRRSPRT